MPLITLDVPMYVTCYISPMWFKLQFSKFLLKTTQWCIAESVKV